MATTLRDRVRQYPYFSLGVLGVCIMVIPLVVGGALLMVTQQEGSSLAERLSGWYLKGGQGIYLLAGWTCIAIGLLVGAWACWRAAVQERQRHGSQS